MDEILNLLRQLQEHDLEIQAIESKTTTLQESLDELRTLHDSLAESLDAQKTDLDETRSLMRDKSLELETNEDRYKQSKAKLSQVSNTREYNALEKEMDALKKMRAQLEEEYEQLKEAVEGSEADVAEKEEKTSVLRNQIEEEEAAIAKESQGAEKKISKIRVERDKLKETIPKKMVRRYEFIASRRPGRAICAAHNGVCSECNMLVPPQLFNELQQARKMISCPSCQRILYFQDGDGASASA